jgi:hypothetical protein
MNFKKTVSTSKPEPLAVAPGLRSRFARVRVRTAPIRGQAAPVKKTKEALMRLAKMQSMPARYSEHLLAAKGAVAQYYQRRAGV